MVTGADDISSSTGAASSAAQIQRRWLDAVGGGGLGIGRALGQRQQRRRCGRRIGAGQEDERAGVELGRLQQRVAVGLGATVGLLVGQHAGIGTVLLEPQAAEQAGRALGPALAVGPAHLVHGHGGLGVLDQDPGLAPLGRRGRGGGVVVGTGRAQVGRQLDAHDVVWVAREQLLALRGADDVVGRREHRREVRGGRVEAQRAEGSKVGHGRMVATMPEFRPGRGPCYGSRQHGIESLRPHGSSVWPERS